MLKTLLSLGEWVTEVIHWATVSYASDGWLIEEMSAAVATMLECSGCIVVPSRCSAQRPQICLIVSPLVQPIGILSHTHITSNYIIHSIIHSLMHSFIIHTSIRSIAYGGGGTEENIGCEDRETVRTSYLVIDYIGRRDDVGYPFVRAEDAAGNDDEALGVGGGHLGQAGLAGDEDGRADHDLQRLDDRRGPVSQQKLHVPPQYLLMLVGPPTLFFCFFRSSTSSSSSSSS